MGGPLSYTPSPRAEQHEPCIIYTHVIETYTWLLIQMGCGTDGPGTECAMHGATKEFTMRALLIMALFTTCAPFKADASDKSDAAAIVLEMIKHHESCDKIQDFLLDSALDHGIEWDCTVSIEKNIKTNLKR